MTLMQQCLSLVRKYGPAARVVATGVLNVVAPGSGTLIDLAGKAIDAASQAADKTAREDWERDLLARVEHGETELARVGQLLEHLTGPLAVLCDKAAAFADQPDDLPDIIARAIAANPALSQVLHEVGGLKEQFDVFQADIRKVAERQEEAVPVYARMNRVADYFDELWQAGIKPANFAQCVRMQMEAAGRIEQGQTGDLDNLLLELRTRTPKAASVLVLEAAAAAREFNYPAAQRALKAAVRLKPGDVGLLDISRGITKLESDTGSLPTPPAPRSRVNPGDTLDGWLLDARLGAGGWGQVFKASRDSQTKALKVMHSDFTADRAFVERFKKEIETLIKLPRHANLVRIEGFGYCPQRQTWYLTMEYVDGPTLEQHLASKGPLSESEVRKVFADVVEGLAKAHAAGIVHRDIKPGNLIFRQSDQRLVFVDFGLAVGVEDFGQTRVGGLTIQFAAPEQHYGERATQASDVFSICAVIHYALNYDKPDLRKPHRFNPSQAPQSLRDVLTRGLTSNVDDRLSDAARLWQWFGPRPDVLPATPVEQKPAPAVRKVGDVIEVPLDKTLKMKFAWVPPGISWLGGGGGTRGEKQFTLDTGLWCGVYPVAQAEWQAVLGDNPSHFKNKPRNPVENVSWNRVQEFLKTLNSKRRDDALSYRLPTEEEWEYICRGGALSTPDQSQYHFYFARSKTDFTPAPTDDLSSMQANFRGTYPAGKASEGPYLQATSQVGLYLPNPLGIYDLYGNVSEYCSSEEGGGPVTRGGSWFLDGRFCVASERDLIGPENPGPTTGFRLLAVPVA